MNGHPDKEMKEMPVFRQTNTQTGRHLAVAPDNSAMKHLSYGRIRLDAEAAS
jgi:hypothetical protein